MAIPTHDAFGRPWKPHHIEFCWVDDATGRMEARCRDCDDAVRSHPMVNNYRDAHHAQAFLRNILEEGPCCPRRQGPIIVGGSE
jgi:hypothetical protein